MRPRRPTRAGERKASAASTWSCLRRAASRAPRVTLQEAPREGATRCSRFGARVPGAAQGSAPQRGGRAGPGERARRRPLQHRHRPAGRHWARRARPPPEGRGPHTPRSARGSLPCPGPAPPPQAPGFPPAARSLLHPSGPSEPVSVPPTPQRAFPTRATARCAVASQRAGSRPAPQGPGAWPRTRQRGRGSRRGREPRVQCHGTALPPVCAPQAPEPPWVSKREKESARGSRGLEGARGDALTPGGLGQSLPRASRARPHPLPRPAARTRGAGEERGPSGSGASGAGKGAEAVWILLRGFRGTREWRRKEDPRARCEQMISLRGTPRAWGQGSRARFRV